MVELKNYMEELVWDHLDRVLDQYPAVCRCEKCRYDMAALALNNLPPRYVVTDKGKTYTKVKTLEQQFETDIITAITQAVEKVAHAMRHGE